MEQTSNRIINTYLFFQIQKQHFVNFVYQLCNPKMQTFIVYVVSVDCLLMENLILPNFTP